MNFGFSEEQQRLRGEVRRFLDERCPLAEVRRHSATASGYCEKLWGEIADLGWLGITVDEAYGGSGLGWVDAIVVLEEMGRSLFPSPILGHSLAMAAIGEFGSEAQQQRWLPGLARGERVATLALFEANDWLEAAGIQTTATPDADGFVLRGSKRYVPDVGAATLCLVAARDTARDGFVLAVIEGGAAGLTAAAHPMIDETRRMGNLDLEDVRVAREDAIEIDASAIAALRDTGALLVTADASGAVDAAIRLTTDYAKQRIQFDKPIGQFQGVKHPLAEMYTDLESFRSLLYYAAWCRDTGHEDLARYVSLAKAYATDAFVRTGLDSIQLHGAIGFTTDYDIQLYFKRSKWMRPMYGDADFHYERVLALRGL